MAIPLLRYRVWQSKRNLCRLVEPLLTTWDAAWAGYMGKSLQDMPMDLRIPPLATDAELQRLSMPVLALGAADDISFPGEAVVARIRSQVPHADGEVIAECKHCPPTTDEFREWLASRLTGFFAAGQTPKSVNVDSGFSLYNCSGLPSAIRQSIHVTAAEAGKLTVGLHGVSGS